MVDPVVWCVVLSGARLAYSFASLCAAPARERAQAAALATLLRAAGPGGVVKASRPDGTVVIAALVGTRSHRDAEVPEMDRRRSPAGDLASRAGGR